MNKPVCMDAEYESIRAVMNSRGTCGNQLPGKSVAYIPAERAERVLDLDRRIQVLQKIAPFIIVGTSVLISFCAGRAF